MIRPCFSHADLMITQLYTDTAATYLEVLSRPNSDLLYSTAYKHIRISLCSYYNVVLKSHENYSIMDILRNDVHMIM